MSYILDALRRADAERERGSVPGLNTQPLPPPAAERLPVRRWLPWALGGAAALLLAAGVGWWLRPAPPVLMAQAPPDEAARPPNDAAPRPPRVETPPAPPPRGEAPPMRSETPPPMRPAPPPAAGPLPRPAALPAAPAAAPRPPAASAPPPAVRAAAAPAAASAPPAVVPYTQLADDVRRQLPTLALGGAIYSEHAASRMLIVSGQLMREGDTVAPGVVLEQIRPRSAVLRWRDVRYEVTL
jgi:general secretion pathway protein B